MIRKRVNRAAQFQPFDALKGLREALQAKEEKMAQVARRELPEEQQCELSDMLNKIERGLMIEVVFYFNGHYVSLIGQVENMNIAHKYLVVDKAKIYFDDIYSIVIL